MRRDLILCLGASCLGFVGAMMIGRAGGHDFTDTAPPRIVVAMTSHEVVEPGDYHLHHFFRVWSDGYTEWNCRSIDIGENTVFWGEWQAIEDATEAFCP